MYWSHILAWWYCYTGHSGSSHEFNQPTRSVHGGVSRDIVGQTGFNVDEYCFKAPFLAQSFHNSAHLSPVEAVPCDACEVTSFASSCLGSWCAKLTLKSASPLATAPTIQALPDKKLPALERRLWRFQAKQSQMHSAFDSCITLQRRCWESTHQQRHWSGGEDLGIKHELQ